MTAEQMNDDVIKGQAVYSKTVLALYDLWVLGISNRFFWRCKTAKMLAQFDAFVTNKHLDVGVGTGYYLDKCHFPSQNPRLALLDLNQNSLDATAARIARYKPRTFRHNVLEPVALGGPISSLAPFDSISVNYLFHCLPGRLSEKLTVLDHLNLLLSENGRIFGATIVQGNAPRNPIARRLMAIYNKKGIFSNTEDTFAELEAFLASRYEHYNIKLEGCVALFWAKDPHA